MAGTLSIVATPIGHLEDITLRALKVLRTVDLIAAEDTRHTGKLLSHYGIATPTLSFHQHNTRARVPGLIEKLKQGQSIALVSDAGTPVMSDPGLELIQACIGEGIEVDAIPGPSAPLALAVVSGFPFSPWTVFGFPPIRSSDRNRWLSKLAEVQHSVTFLEAPHRINVTLQQLVSVSVDRPIVVGRELTKMHQTLYRGMLSTVASQGIEARGELTVMLGPVPVREETREAPTDDTLATEFGEITETSRGGRREVIRELAGKYGLATRDVYAALERVKARLAQAPL